MEADGTKSKKDFQHKISICKKEAKEIKHWLRMLAGANSAPQNRSFEGWSTSDYWLIIE